MLTEFGDLLAASQFDAPSVEWNDHEPAAASTYTVVPPDFKVLPPGSYENARAEETINQVSKAALLRTTMKGRGLDSNSLADHVDQNLGPLKVMFQSKYRDAFFEKTKVVLTQEIVTKWFCLYGLLCAYQTSVTAYFADTKQPARYAHSVHCLRENLFRCLLELFSDRSQRRAFHPDEKIEAMEVALVEGFAINLKCAVFSNLAVDDLHEQQSSGQANQEGFVITQNPMKARPFGTTTDIATTSGGVPIAILTHLHHRPNAAQTLMDRVTANLEAAGHHAREKTMNVDRGYEKFGKLCMAEGFHLRQTTQRASNRSRGAHSVPEAKLSVANRVKFGTHVMHPTKLPFQHWVKEEFSAPSGLAPLYHLASTNGNGKTLLISTTRKEDVNVNVILFDTLGLRRLSTQTVALPLPPFVVPEAGGIFPYPAILYENSIAAHCRELCPQGTPVWWEMRNGGTTSTTASNAVKMDGQAQRWTAIMGAETHPQLYGVRVQILPGDGDTTRKPEDLSMRVTSASYLRYRRTADILLCVSRHVHEIDKAMLDVAGTKIETADSAAINRGLKFVKITPGNKTLPARRALLVEGRKAFAERILLGDPALLIANKAFVATEAVKEGLIEEGTIRAEFPAWYLKVRLVLLLYLTDLMQCEQDRGIELAASPTSRWRLLNVSSVREMPIVECLEQPHVRDSPDGVFVRIRSFDGGDPELQHVVLECKNLTGDVALRECRQIAAEFGPTHELRVDFEPVAQNETAAAAKMRLDGLGKLLGKLCGSPGYAIQCINHAACVGYGTVSIVFRDGVS